MLFVGRVSWLAQVAAPDLGIAAGDRLELFDWQAHIALRYALPLRDPPREGEARTLLVWHVEPYGLGLHRRFLLLASPPLAR